MSQTYAHTYREICLRETYRDIERHVYASQTYVHTYICLKHIYIHTERCL